VWVVGHRGASGHAPENTLAAFRRAVELGATFIETDLQVTRDSCFVALHDDTLDRTTNGRGPVHRHTLVEVRELDAGSWYGPQFTGQRIPTLEEILQFTREKDVVFYLEMKARGVWGLEHSLIASLRASGVAARTVLLSFDPATLAAVRHIEATLMTGLLCDQPSGDVVARAVRAGARQLAPRADLVSPALIAEARSADLQVVTWTVNEPRHIRALVSMGVDGIMSDYPDRLVTALSKSSAG
jgi:glycerophosphoryl diester phosphodiesterase